ncbi:MAG TPA: glycosyltransferase family 39 protein [Candidatus Sulfotelmatobacter sp.]|nr:glycosyltransferase family 39 protein [Candidatus Sulfotelmatobacter sp.]
MLNLRFYNGSGRRDVACDVSLAIAGNGAGQPSDQLPAGRVDARGILYHEIPPRFYYAGLLLVILLVSGIRFHLRDMPLERDEGEYAYAGQLILQGIPPYELAYNMKLPGTYAAYAAIMAIFGQTAAGIRLGVLLVNAANIVLVFVLAQKLAGELAALVAGTTYGVLSILPATLGFAVHATHFVVLFALAGILVLWRALNTQRDQFLFFCGGLLLGVAFIMKQPGIAFAAFGALYVAHCTWRQARLLLTREAVFLAGAALPFVLTCLVMARAGVLRAFWFWTFTYARVYSSETTLATGWQALRQSVQWVLHPFPLWAIAELGFVALFWDRRWHPQVFFLTALTACSALAVSAGLYFRPHYFILVLPAASILAGLAITSARDFLMERGHDRRAGQAALLVFFAACAFSLWNQRAFLFELDPASAGQRIYAANPFAEAITVAKTVRDSTTEADTIAVFGSEPEIYFLSGRHSATSYIYMYDLTKPQPYQRQMQQELMRQLEAARPRIVIYVDDWASWGWKLGQEHDEFFTWMEHYIREGYEPVQQIQINALPAHRWGDGAKLYVFARKDSGGHH